MTELQLKPSHGVAAHTASGTPDGSKLSSGARSRTIVSRVVVIAAALIALIGAPEVVSPYVLSVLILIAVTLLPVAGLSLLLGFGGQISIGQAAFVGLGAYFYSDCTTRLHMNPWLSMALGVIAAYGFAWCIGRPILRLRGYYLGMATLGLTLIASSFFSDVTGLTGGYSGIPGVPAPSIFGLQLDTPKHFYFYCVIVAGGVFLLLLALSSGDYSRRLRAMRESEAAASAYGINIASLKSEVFAIASAVAALGGMLYAQNLTFVSPDSFTLNNSIMYMLAAVIGGLGSIWGGLIGAVYVILLPEILKSNGAWETVVSGAVIMLVMTLAPGGAIELLTKLRDLLLLPILARVRRGPRG